MQTHYFQRYHQEENVATANTMLLLSQLYHLAPNSFYRVIGEKIFNSQIDNFNPQISFILQKKERNSVPDAVIEQQSFKLVVETKMNGQKFEKKQLLNHLNAFGDAQHEVLVTIAPEEMDARLKKEIDNEADAKGASHWNVTFENLAAAIEDALDERSDVMREWLEDYRDYCYEDKLINDSWKQMRVVACGNTFEFNKENGVYYRNSTRGYHPHDYLGLYQNKSVRAIGRIVAIIEGEPGHKDDDSKFVMIKERKSDGSFEEQNKIAPERKQIIKNAIENGKQYGYDLNAQDMTYFFVDSFYETDYRKPTSGGLWGTRYFDLKASLGGNDEFKPGESAESVAGKLKGKTWF